MRSAVIALGMFALGVAAGLNYNRAPIGIRPGPGFTVVGDGIFFNDSQFKETVAVLGNHAFIMNSLFQGSKVGIHLGPAAPEATFQANVVIDNVVGVCGE